jgi:hypothetical protein
MLHANGAGDYLMALDGFGNVIFFAGFIAVMAVACWLNSVIRDWWSK